MNMNQDVGNLFQVCPWTQVDLGFFEDLRAGILMQREKTNNMGPSFTRFRSSRFARIAVAKICVLLFLALFAYVPAGFAQARQEVAEPEILVNAATVEFSIIPREPELTYYPCTQCHQFLAPNPEVRELLSPHPSTLDHGDQRMWCLTCHKIDDRDYLTNLLGESIDYDSAAELCASCHMQRHKDWMFGGHGKRASNWQGERVIYSCPHCHDPHSPMIEPRAPKPLPPLRKGLEHPEIIREAHPPAWERPEEPNHE
jgi:hypothetical protein